MPWTEKYRPKTFEEIKGQDAVIEKIKFFISNFPKNKKALILHGPPGVGKTTLAYVIGNEKNAEVFELNASDLRNKDQLTAVLKPATEQMSLVKKSKIILVDEADGISGYYDKGGVSELISLIESTSYPIIITANDVWNKKLTPLRKKCEVVQLKEIDYKTIKDTLISVLRRENKFIEGDILTSIAIKSKGDLRAAINDLQIAVGMSDPSKILEQKRDTQTDIFNALRIIFKEKPTENTLKIFDEVKMPLEEIMLWVEENIPREYQGEELVKAIDSLSRADIFKGRIYKQQYWRFLVYQNILLSYGVSAKKDANKIRSGFTSYKRPSRILKIWMNNQKM